MNGGDNDIPMEIETEKISNLTSSDIKRLKEATETIKCSFVKINNNNFRRRHALVVVDKPLPTGICNQFEDVQMSH